MHRILSYAGDENLALGGKGRNILKLDKYNLTPDFVLIPSQALSAGAGLGHNASEKDVKDSIFSCKFISEVEAAISDMGEGPLIVRSSCLTEDSSTASYAGMFSSIVCGNRKDIFETIRKVWLSSYLPRAQKYRSAHADTGLDMAVIVQRFITAEISGVLFYCRGRNTAYVEYAAGGGEKIVSGTVRPSYYIHYHGNSFTGNSSESGNIDWLEELVYTAEKYASAEQESCLDIEFALCGGRIYLLQSRPVTAEFDPFSQNYAFPPRADYCDYDIKDEDIPAVSELMGEYGFAVPKFLLYDGDHHISGPELAAFVDQLEKMAEDPVRVAFFCREFLSYMKKEMDFLKKLGQFSLEDILKCLKKLNFKYQFRDFVHVSLQKILERKIIAFYGMEWWQKNAYLFTSGKSFNTKKLAAIASKGGTFSGEMENKGFEEALSKNADRILGISGRENRELSGEALRISASLKPLIYLRDEMNYYYSIVSSVYHKIISNKTHYQGEISGLCRYGVGEIMDILGGRGCVKRKKNGKLLRSFPLRGYTACGGSVSGPAVIIREFKDIYKIKKGDILVAEYTSPNLILGMTECAGIVTEQGGLTSHAAIVSRELNKPCLVGCEGCLSSVKDGDTVEIAHNVLNLIKRRGN